MLPMSLLCIAWKKQSNLCAALNISLGCLWKNRHVLHLRVLGIRQSVRGLVFAVHCFFFVILKLGVTQAAQAHAS